MSFAFEPLFWVGVTVAFDLGCDIGDAKGADVLQDVPYQTKRGKFRKPQISVEALGMTSACGTICDRNPANRFPSYFPRTCSNSLVRITKIFIIEIVFPDYDRASRRMAQ